MEPAALGARQGLTTRETIMNTSDMTAKIAAGKGFIAALDQSGGSTPKRWNSSGWRSGSSTISRSASIVEVRPPRSS